jgi:hypothetical protein
LDAEPLAAAEREEVAGGEVIDAEVRGAQRRDVEPTCHGPEARDEGFEPLAWVTLAPLPVGAAGPGGWNESRNCRIGAGTVPWG